MTVNSDRFVFEDELDDDSLESDRFVFEDEETPDQSDRFSFEEEPGFMGVLAQALEFGADKLGALNRIPAGLLSGFLGTAGSAMGGDVSQQQDPEAEQDLNTEKAIRRLIGLDEAANRSEEFVDILSEGAGGFAAFPALPFAQAFGPAAQKLITGEGRVANFLRAMTQPGEGSMMQQALTDAQLGAEFEAGRFGAEELGMGETGQTITGLLAPIVARAGAAGFQAARKAMQAEVPRVLTEEGTRVVEAEIRSTPQKQLAKEVNRIGEERLNQLSEGINTEITPREAEYFDARAARERLISEEKADALNNIAEPAETQQQAWTSVQDSVQKNFKSERAAASEIYQEVEPELASRTYKANRAVESIDQFMSDASVIDFAGQEEAAARKVAIRAKGELGEPTIEEVKSRMKPILEDLEKGGITKTDLTLEEFEEIFRRVNYKEPITMEEGWKVAQALDEYVKYSDLLPGQKKRLSPIVQEMKKEILEQLPDDIANRLTQADEAWKDIGTRYGNDYIKQLRSTDAPELLQGEARVGSKLEALQKVVAEDSPEYLQALREIGEDIANMEYDKAQKALREIKPHVSEEQFEAIQSAAEWSDNLSKPGARATATESILTEVNAFAETGAAPSKTKDRMLSGEKGYDFVKDTLSTNPAGRKVFQAIEGQIVQEALSGLVDELGVVDWAKVGKLVEDPNMMRIIESHLGKEGAEAFSELGSYAQNYQKNMQAFAKQPVSVKQKIMSETGHGFKAMMMALGSSVLGLPGKVGLATYYGVRGMVRTMKYLQNKVLASDKGRAALKAFQDPKVWTDPRRFEAVYKKHGKVFEDLGEEIDLEELD